MKKTKTQKPAKAIAPQRGLTFVPSAPVIDELPKKGNDGGNDYHTQFKVIADYALANLNTFTLNDFVSIRGDLDFSIVKYYFDAFTAKMEKAGRIKKLPSCDSQVWLVV
jgi:hypothetical protein